MPNPLSRVTGLNATVTARDASPARFEELGKTTLKLKEASDIVALPGGKFLAVGDTSDKVLLVGADGKSSRIDLPEMKNGKSQMEGVAYDPQRHHLFVSREESREILRYKWNPEKDKAPKLEERRKLKNVDGPINKGIEGLAFVSGDQSPTGKDQLLMVKEGNPRSLMMADADGEGKLLEVKLEDQVKSVCKDFSAVTVDPKSGNVFISSDESSTIAQVALSRDGDKIRGRLVQSFPLRDGNKPLARIEGLATNANGDLFVLTENTGDLFHLKRR